MAPAVDHRPETRPILLLHSRETFSDDLGGFGEEVRPRQAGMRFRGAEEEAFCLRRLLVAWKKLGLLEFPVEVHRRGPGDGHPDFDLHLGAGRHLLGVEHTNAGAQAYQRHLTLTDGSTEAELGEGDGWAGDSVETTVMTDLRNAIERKRSELHREKYSNTPDCDLLVYELSEAGIMAPDLSKTVARLREAERAADRETTAARGFRQVHLIFGETVVVDALGDGMRHVDVSGEYEIDVTRWALEQARKAREEGAQALDLDHVAEEIESLGRSNERERDSHLETLVLHLLKAEFQPERFTRSWAGTIQRCRSDVERIVAQSPSLNPLASAKVDAAALLAKVYRGARRGAVAETGLPATAFPESCPYTVDQILDPDFLPGPVRDEDLQP
jgi:hypothetical protein